MLLSNMSEETFIRLKCYCIDEVLPFIRTEQNLLPVHRTYSEQEVRMNTATLKTFAMKGVKCTKCGLEGKFFALEKTPNNKQDDKFHFNLYGITEKGREVLFTKDHILPKSKGGKSKQENLQPMCNTCNQKKGSKIEITLIEKPIQTISKLIIRDEDKIPAENFLGTVSVNVDNLLLSDAEFRQFIRNTLPIVKF